MRRQQWQQVKWNGRTMGAAPYVPRHQLHPDEVQDDPETGLPDLEEYMNGRDFTRLWFQTILSRRFAFDILGEGLKRYPELPRQIHTKTRGKCFDSHAVIVFGRRTLHVRVNVRDQRSDEYEQVRQLGRLTKYTRTSPDITKRESYLSEPLTVNETVLQRVQQSIQDDLDSRMKHAPSFSQVFTFYCRDRKTLRQIEREHHWSYRTLKSRKRGLDIYLREKYNLSLAAFLVDRSMFDAMDLQIAAARKARARLLSRRQAGELPNSNDGSDTTSR